MKIQKKIYIFFLGGGVGRGGGGGRGIEVFGKIHKKNQGGREGGGQVGVVLVGGSEWI